MHKSHSCLLVSSVAALLLGGAAHAATPAAATLAGPVIKGMCVLNRADVFANAKAAQSANVKYRAAFDQAQAEITKEREKLEGEARALQAKKAALTAEAFQKGQAELADRVKALQQKATEHTQDLEATRRDVVARIATEAQPLIEQIYTERGCGLLLSREAILAGNVEMDITQAVIAALDRKISDLPFERAHVASSAAR